MEYNYMSFLTDFCFMSLLLVIAQFMRAKIKFLQMFYIPASLVAGILGLLLGPQFLDLIPWSGQIGSYAYMLVCVLFGGLFLGQEGKDQREKDFHPGGRFLLRQYGCGVLLLRHCFAGGRRAGHVPVPGRLYRNRPADALRLLRRARLRLHHWYCPE